MVMKRTVLLGVLLSIMLIVSACSPMDKSSTTASMNDTVAYSNPVYSDTSGDNSKNTTDTTEATAEQEQPESIGEVEADKNAKVITDTKYYKVTRSGYMYYYWIYDENHQVVKADGPLNKEPHITMANDHLVCFTFSAGPQRATTWSYYYDTDKDVFSRNYDYVLAQYGDLVACGEWNNEQGYIVVVRNIFDKTNYYQEITTFKDPFSGPIEPITGAEFINAGTALSVTYQTGADYKEVTENFELPPATQ